jgi:putative flippase GtrA
MRLLAIMPERWHKLVHEALKFGIVGGVNTVINYAVFNALALTLFRDGQLKATVIATIVATITSYFMNRHWTYRDRPKSAMRRETTLFVLFNASGLMIELGVLAIAKYGLDIHGLLALNIFKTVGLAIATVFRFWSYRTFVFRPAPMTDLPVSPAPVPPAPVTPQQAARSHGIDADVLASFDPVAELAEVVSEMEATAGHSPRKR